MLILRDFEVFNIFKLKIFFYIVYMNYLRFKVGMKKVNYLVNEVKFFSD